MPSQKNDSEKRIYNWIMDEVYTEALYSNLDPESEEDMSQIIKGLRDAANELEKPFKQAEVKGQAMAEDYNPNDPRNW